jgi:hypothetical protein
MKKNFLILAIITATKRKDGSGSYCEVAQSEIVFKKILRNLIFHIIL